MARTKSKSKLKSKNNSRTKKPTTIQLSKKIKGRKMKLTTTVGKPQKGGIGNIFHFPMGQQKRNFSTTFEYGNIYIHAKTKGNNVIADFKLSGKNFNVAGTVILDEKTFNQLQKMTNQVVSSISR